MTTTNFPHGFADGLIVRGVPLLNSYTGNVYWCDNSTVNPREVHKASDYNHGTFTTPMATLAGALTKTVANRGDIIMVGANHAETISSATALALSVAGVAIIGLGQGSARPTFTLDTANTTNIAVTAANVTLQNLIFVGNFLSIASVFTATGTATPTDFTIDNCEFRDTSAVLGFLSIFTGNATANSCDGLQITRSKVYGLGTVSPTVAITTLSNTNRLNITDNVFVYPVTATTQGPAVLAGGASNFTNFVFARNQVYRPNTSSSIPLAISSSSTACTGICSDNYLYGVPSGTGIWISTGTKLGFVNNYSPITGAYDKSALINPVAV